MISDELVHMKYYLFHFQII